MTHEPCDTCRGAGKIMVSEWNDQYDHTHQSYDVCPDCDGTRVTIRYEDEEPA